MKTTRFYYDLACGDLLGAVFVDRALERALPFRAADAWCTELLTLEPLGRLLEGEVLLDSNRNDVEGTVLDLRHAVVSIELERRHDTAPSVRVTVHAASRQAAKLELARLKELIPPAEAPPANRIQVAFWYLGQHGPSKVFRRLAAPAWSDSAVNYPAPTRSSLEHSMGDASAVIARGRLLLWHGPPGTGKTSALRTLALENSGTFAVEYVLDPEAMFGKDSGYFISVLFDDDGDGDHEESRRTRLLVMEDCDELLSADAKDRAGQGLARLLNLVDGMIGQGLDIAVLITTNEPLGAFHPAVIRPGRCGQVVSFDLFSPDEAVEWLRRHGRPVGEADRLSLADLFAVRDGHSQAARASSTTRREPIGFVGRGRR
jgi:hypothetical protein